MTTIFDVADSNPPNPFTSPIQVLLTSFDLSSGPTPDETASQLVRTVATSLRPANALWELWDAFFVAVVTSSTSKAPLLALLNALQAQPPTQPRGVLSLVSSYTQAHGKLHWSELPRFSAQWSDVHDILQARRHLADVRTYITGDDAQVSTSRSSSALYYLRFCIFSAALIQSHQGKGPVHPINVFYACKDVLERERPLSSRLPNAHRMPSDQRWALDVRVAATWVRGGGRALWEMDHKELREHWAAALDEKTELWPEEDGLTLERWRLWAERLQFFNIEEKCLDEETRVVAAEAARVIRGLVEKDST